jgi:hypothetical protein
VCRKAALEAARPSRHTRCHERSLSERIGKAGRDRGGEGQESEGQGKGYRGAAWPVYAAHQGSMWGGVQSKRSERSDGASRMQAFHSRIPRPTELG